jgi:hypothetical protein
VCVCVCASLEHIFLDRAGAGMDSHELFLGAGEYTIAIGFSARSTKFGGDQERSDLPPTGDIYYGPVFFVDFVVRHSSHK